MYLGECFAHRHETSPGDCIDYIKHFYVKNLILTDVTIRSVFQNPVTYTYDFKHHYTALFLKNEFLHFLLCRHMHFNFRISALGSKTQTGNYLL